VNRLAENPDQRAQVVADPDLAPHAINEALRYDMPTQMLGRRVRKEIEIQGKTLQPGQGLLFMWASANRDEREFPDPDRFDIHRRARRILTFGSGEHMCLGAHMARMEGKVMLEELLRVIPEYEVDVEHATMIRSEVFRGFLSLPIRW
jgi:cytochrome P450